MYAFDMRTVLFTGMLTDIIGTLVVVSLWHQNRRRFCGMGYWVADFFFQTLGLLMISLRGVIPDWMSIVLSNTLVISGAMLGYHGLALFVGRRVSQAANGFLLAVFVLIQCDLAFFHPNLIGRCLNIAVVLLLVCAQCVWLLLRGADAAMRPLVRWVGLVFGAHCLVFMFRIGWLLAHPDLSSDYFRSGPVEALFFVVLQMLFVLLTYGFGLMVNRRLLLAIQAQEEKYSKTFHASPYAIILTRVSDGKILEVNNGFTKVTGYSLEDIYGKSTFDLDLWAHAEDRVSVVDKLTKIGEVSGAELQFKKKSGELMTGLYSAVNITINNEACILASVNDITERKCAEAERVRLISEREKALSEVKTLSGLLPICASCKKIRDDKGYWNRIETYLRMHSGAEFTHGICPDCMRLHYAEFLEEDSTP